MSQLLPALPATAIPIALIAALPVLLLAAWTLVSPALDPREPPVLRPRRLPLVGHAVDILSERAGFYWRIWDESRLAACTLPVAHTKIYVVNSPALVQAVMRTRTLSFAPFALRIGQALGFMPPGDVFPGRTEEEIMDQSSAHYHAGLSGDNLQRLNAVALGEVADAVNVIAPGEWTTIPDLMLWLRRIIGLATSQALFGDGNPFVDDIDTAMDDIATFEEKIAILLMTGPLSPLLARTAIQARTRLQQTLLPYIASGADSTPDVSAVIRARGAHQRACGWADTVRATDDFALLWVGTTNTVPNLFWLVVEVFSRPAHVARIRDEVLAVALARSKDENNNNTVELSVAALEKQCPFLLACWRETLRTTAEVVGNREVMADTVLRDSGDDGGREYLLRKGASVQWSSRVSHMSERIWGAEPERFDPERFLQKDDAAVERMRRTNLIPFGGGKSLCPGRNFAMAESLCLVAALAVGFELDDVKVPPSACATMGVTVRPPVWGDLDKGIRIRRQAGWEDVVWKFS